MMRLTGQKIFDATLTLAKIIDDKRPLPGKGAYRVVRMHTKLLAEFNVLNTQRTAKIATYGHEAWADRGGNIAVSAEDAIEWNKTAADDKKFVLQSCVPADKMPDFVSWWGEIASVEIDVNVEPIPIDQLCLDGKEASITFAEFAVLGELVTEG